MTLRLRYHRHYAAPGTYLPMNAGETIFTRSPPGTPTLPTRARVRRVLLYATASLATAFALINTATQPPVRTSETPPSAPQGSA